MPTPATPLLDIDAATVMRGQHVALDHFSLRMAAGEHTVILGPNGAGKSTLVQLIARQLYPLAEHDGRCTVRVFDRERWNVSELRGLIGIVSPVLQRDYTSDDPVEVFDAVVSGFFAARGLALDLHATAPQRERARAALDQLGASHLIGRPMASLSTGEARRVLIARALVHQPRALLLDEPCAGLDLASRRRFLEHLRTLARGGTTLLLVTHHVEEILPEIDRVLVLKAGRVLHEGRKAATLTDAVLSDAFGMPVRVRERDGWYGASLA
ncbi:MAG: ATP-binding cassette domain-containing protein [Rhodanobacter sp.]|nr:MAG: ATP-binding cassette domain-containing protein [Rhodanobacter sp.]TAM15225.1 MAG: ATP-binding cassette domain-containing protein [Rhodanobacter sp.]TAM36668.1 MAG: ATP-binding cassette domain-containing protein [Rhodanobacter sp.]